MRLKSGGGGLSLGAHNMGQELYGRMGKGITNGYVMAIAVVVFDLEVFPWPTRRIMVVRTTKIAWNLFPRFSESINPDARILLQKRMCFAGPVKTMEIR